MTEKVEFFTQYETIIDKINEILKALDEHLQENIKIALLIGNTGSGKSTIFNFLAGFELMIDQENHRQFVRLKNSDQKGASVVKGGLKSVTKEPNYYYNQDQNCLLIDFPGFNDTNGLMQRAFIDILFNRLVMKSQVKVIHVVKLSNDEFPNRAADLQSFVNQCIGSNHYDVSKVVIFCNYWSEEQEEEVQKELLKESLKEIYNQDFETIELIQRIKSDQDFDTKLNQQKRQNLWEIIQKSQTIQLKPALFQHQSEIVLEINNKCLAIIQSIVKLIVDSLETNLKTLKKDEIESLLSCILEMNMLIEYQIKQDVYAWYQEIINICKRTAEILKQNCVEEKENKAFLKVFEFLSQQKQVINFHNILEQNSQIIKNQLITQKQAILNQIILLEKKEQSNNQVQHNNNGDLNSGDQIFSQFQNFQIFIELQKQNKLLEKTYKLQKQEKQQINKQDLKQQNQDMLEKDKPERLPPLIKPKEQEQSIQQDDYQRKQQFLKAKEEENRKQEQEAKMQIQKKKEDEQKKKDSSCHIF